MHDPLPVALLCHHPLFTHPQSGLDIATPSRGPKGSLSGAPPVNPLTCVPWVDSVEYLRLLLSRVALLADSETLPETCPANWYVQVRGRP